ncbi:MAG: ABC transporter substrate-binding protein [Oscillospiraceae bacterium]|nr:ABC transporter substrate-binding protein [Oscillospiraceae bacterium]
MNRRLLLIPAVWILLTGCAGHAPAQDIYGLTVTGQMPLSYAAEFSVDYCENGYAVIRTGTESHLLVPEGMPVPADNQLPVIQQPVSHIYAASSAVMDLFDALGALDAVEMTSTDLSSWTLPHVQDAMQRGDLTYIGKYSTPDYEALLETDCGLVIENTMILHAPAVREQIVSLGIPVIVERSSYEAHPLGRMEWIKLYGLLLGKTDKAVRFFDEKAAEVKNLPQSALPEAQRPSAAFFSITANGSVSIRKPGDYISQMIGMAGGRYVFRADDLHVDENALSTMTIQMETFYEIARDADVLIYNSTIEGKPDSLDVLLRKNALLRDFRAVKEQNVWCTELNTFQQTTGAADMIADLNRIFSGQAGELTYLQKLQ